jgi:hypothetical protein
MHDPRIAPVIPFTPEVSAFMGKALKHLKKRRHGGALIGLSAIIGRGVA